MSDVGGISLTRSLPQDTDSSAATTVDLKIFGIAELATTIIAISIPVLRAFVRQNRSPAAQTEFVELSKLPSVQSSRARGGRKGIFSSKERSVTRTVESYSPPADRDYDDWSRGDDVYHRV